ncbi:tripartite tricarboxylate transporter permease [Natrialbaceae archaeon A-CW3]
MISLIDLFSLPVFAPLAIGFIILGVLIGVSMGSIPGMTATMTVAVLAAFTYTMSPVEGMMLMLGIYAGAVYAGSIPAILIRTPGTPSAAATLLDGYPLSEKGEAGRAIAIATVASAVGGIVSVVVLASISPTVARAALNFQSPEYFALAVFGLAIIASISGDKLIKGLITGLAGMLIATIGIDPIQGTTRLTFDQMELTAGIQFVAIMIGLFGISEGLLKFYQGIELEGVQQELDSVIPSLEDLRTISKPTALGGSLGSFIGALPGAGGAIGAFISYDVAKKIWGNETPTFGEGNIRGVAAAESGNNASTGGALIPTLTLGIPGDSVSAILIGVLMIHGISPGPGLFEEETALIYSIFIGFFLAFVFVLIIGLIGAQLWARIINMPPQLLWPVIFILCIIGSVAIRGNFFDAWLMLGAGVLGFLGRLRGYPLAPAVLGMILGPIAEVNLRRSLILSGGEFTIFLSRPITAGVLLLTVSLLMWPLINRLVRERFL